MADDAPKTIPETDPLRLEYCPQCGYLLRGLPLRGLCPECGAAYDESLVVLRGWACGPQATISNSRRVGIYRVQTNVRLIFGLGIIGMVVTPQVLQPLLTELGLPLAVGRYMCPAVLLGVFAAVIAWSVYRRRQLTQDGAPPVQLVLSPDGFGQRDGVGPTRLHRWGRSNKPHLKRRWNGYYRIRSYRWHSFRLADSDNPIDFEIQLDAQIARRLQKRIDAWHDTAMLIRLLERMLRKGRISMEEFIQRRLRIETDLRRRGLARTEPPQPSEAIPGLDVQGDKRPA